MGTAVIALLAAIEILWVGGLCLWIVSERRSPVATLAWIFALALIPVVGIAVYLLIGPRRLHRKRKCYRIARSRLLEISREAQALSDGSSATPEVDARLRQFMTLSECAGEGPPMRASGLELYGTGDDCYAAIERAIAEARHHVHLEYYIWGADRIGTRLRDLLCEKAKSGVHVRLLVDAIGSSALPRKFTQPMLDAGVKVARFNPIALARFRPGLINFRTHRKIVVCDGNVGFTGGVNVCDAQSAQAEGKAAWRDTHLRIEGSPVGSLQLVFLEDWYFATGAAPANPQYFPAKGLAGSGPLAQVLASGPDHDHYAIHKFFFAAIAGARERVLVTTPYFVPDEPILMALVTAALRGVDVKLLVPKIGDSRLVTAAARSYFGDLLRAGVRVFEYGPPMLHAKTLVVDQDIAAVGTANMDNRSSRLNFEVAVAIYDVPTTAALADMFECDLRHAAEYRTRDAKRARLVERVSESTARLFSPIL